MQILRVSLAIVVIAALLAGCASYAWYNPRVPPEIAERDSEQCRGQASYLVNQAFMGYDPTWPGFHDPFVGGFMTSGLALEQDVYHRCMTDKGCTLVKQPKPSRPSGS